MNERETPLSKQNENDIRNRDQPCNADSPLNENVRNLKHINIGSLNVCGLKRRLHYLEFQSLISKYDVFCVQEAKLDNVDVISMPNYTFLSQTRKQKFVRRSGGIGVFVKNELLPFVKI